MPLHPYHSLFSLPTWASDSGSPFSPHLCEAVSHLQALAHAISQAENSLLLASASLHPDLCSKSFNQDILLWTIPCKITLSSSFSQALWSLQKPQTPYSRAEPSISSQPVTLPPAFIIVGLGIIFESSLTSSSSQIPDLSTRVPQCLWGSIHFSPPQPLLPSSDLHHLPDASVNL